MDELLHVASHAATFATTFAIKRSISFASKLAIQQVSSYIKKVPTDHRASLENEKAKLLEIIRVVTPAIELIEIISATGNPSFASTRELVETLRSDITHFIQTISGAFAMEEDKPTTEKRTTATVLREIETLLLCIQDAIPLLNLSLTTSGVSISSSLPQTTSFSNLLLANSYMRKCNLKFNGEPCLLGPKFNIKLYTIFEGHANSKYLSKDTVLWKESMPLGHAYIRRVTSSSQKFEERMLAYELCLDQSFDDGMYHDDDEKALKIRIPLYNIQSLFYSLSGKILRLDNVSSPVLLLKYIIQSDSSVSRRVSKIPDEDDGSSYASWIAIEVLMSDQHADPELSASPEPEEQRKPLNDDELMLRQLMGEPIMTPERPKPTAKVTVKRQYSLTLLEYLIRLCMLESNAQDNILNLPDEQIILYLRDDKGRERPRDPNTYTGLEDTGEAKTPGSTASSKYSSLIASATPAGASPSKKALPLSALAVPSSAASRMRQRLYEEDDFASGNNSPLLRKTKVSDTKVRGKSS
ncbi:ran GTP-binding protein [Schizosaccharomyces japonicus yFS275]|uniref:Ran GTP-binding protein n=1 Tax=Schizosaccharomyces japonicus (strain yFS275 / FY16936) TaxID=402676 RepID=B6JYM9_SCHJY|nr:ran GTP-binding protein [Schizosaccharomyces japonicus yFS275]EEB06647.1 ran GTP-binding protein [Schizosaccharomyces japonicus yFS275]